MPSFDTDEYFAEIAAYRRKESILREKLKGVVLATSGFNIADLPALTRLMDHWSNVPKNLYEIKKATDISYLESRVEDLSL